jgi:hypothetical protein
VATKVRDAFADAHGAVDGGAALVDDGALADASADQLLALLRGAVVADD